MTAIPTKASFTGASVTQGGFKTAHDDLIDALDERLVLATTAVFLKTGSGVGLTASPDGTFHIQTASAGAAAANSNADDLVVENDAAGGIAILTPNNVIARLAFGDPESALAGQVSYDHANTRMNFATEGAVRVSIDENGTLFVNDTANANMTIGLHIEQGESDDEILALASTDVTHGVTVETETNTFAFFKKIGGTTGGLLFEAIREGAITTALQTVAVGGTTDDTDHDTGAVAPFMFDAYKASGTGKVDVGADGNIFVVRNGTTAKFIVDAEGSLFADAGTTTTAVTVFDGEEDIALCRAFDLLRAEKGGSGSQIIRTEWDDWASEHKERLMELGVLCADGEDGARGLVNVIQLQRLHNGTICQLHTALLAIQKRLASAEHKVMALSN